MLARRTRGENSNVCPRAGVYDKRSSTTKIEATPKREPLFLLKRSPSVKPGEVRSLYMRGRRGAGDGRGKEIRRAPGLAAEDEARPETNDPRRLRHERQYLPRMRWNNSCSLSSADPTGNALTARAATLNIRKLGARTGLFCTKSRKDELLRAGGHTLCIIVPPKIGV